MLSQRFSRFALAVAVLGMLGFAAPAVTQAAGPGTSPDEAVAPSNSTMRLNPGQDMWFAFNTGGKDKNDDPSHALILLRPSIAGCATFKLWTKELLKQFNTQDSEHRIYAMGQGTKLEYQDGSNKLDRYGGDLVWNGGFNDPGSFYVQVGSTGDKACDFNLAVTGDTLTFPAAAMAASAAAQPAGAAPAPAENAMSSKVASDISAAHPGSSPDTAFPTSGVWRATNNGQTDWYVVTVPGSTDSADNPLVVLQLTARPGADAGFTVWTKERLAQRATTADAKDAPPVGMGAVSYWDADRTLPRNGGDPMWAGSAKKPTTFYVAVTPTGLTPVDYNLNVATQP